ncbi:MAG: ComEC family competence protein [Cohaesibacter sp.]|nr:ComEC family competence protein [Cohaesibacter sp.]
MPDQATEKGEKATEKFSALSGRAKEALYAGHAYELKPSILRRCQFWLERQWHHGQDQWRHDCEFNSALLLWSAFLLALGAAAYSIVPDEPVWWLLLSVTFALGVGSVRKAQQGGHFSSLLFLFCFFCGINIASLHGQFAGTPLLTSERSATVVGYLEAIEYRPKDQRWTIAVETIDGLSQQTTPKKLLLIRRAKGARFDVGDRIEAWARLIPLQRQAFPGAFDYARYLWARQIGGQGYLGKNIQTLPEREQEGLFSLWRQAWAKIEMIRLESASYLLDHMDREAGALAAALMVGKRDHLRNATKDALRLSGLAHILAISGLHMALVTLTVFGGVRFVASFFERLALHFDIKKLAAAAALVVATCYLFVSGFGVATIRAFVMMAIFLGAILAGRPALSLHNVALALILLVIMQPFSVVEPGLQMSFAATIILIAGYRYLDKSAAWHDFMGKTYETGHEQPSKRHGGNKVFKSARIMAASVFRWFLGIGLTALLAGLATLPFSIAFFNQMAPMGLPVNMLAMPVLSLAVMPFALAAILLIPFGLQQWPFLVMEWGLNQIIQIARWGVDLSPQDALLASAPAGFALVCALGLAFLAFHPNRLAFCALCVLGIGYGLFSFFQIPANIWIAENGRAFAVRDQEGRWVFAGIKENSFLAQVLLKREADQRALPDMAVDSTLKHPLLHDAYQKEAIQCDQDSCSVTLFSKSGKGRDFHAERNGFSIILVKKVRAFAMACARADILVTALVKPSSCLGPLFVADRFLLKQQGSHFIWLEADQEKEQAQQDLFEKSKTRSLSVSATNSSPRKAIDLMLNIAPCPSDKEANIDCYLGMSLYSSALDPVSGWLDWQHQDDRNLRHSKEIKAIGISKIKSAHPHSDRMWQK